MTEIFSAIGIGYVVFSTASTTGILVYLIYRGTCQVLHELQKGSVGG